MTIEELKQLRVGDIVGYKGATYAVVEDWQKGTAPNRQGVIAVLLRSPSGERVLVSDDVAAANWLARTSNLLEEKI